MILCLLLNKNEYFCKIIKENSFRMELEGCIIVSKPTDDSTIDGKEIFGEDFKDNYTGIVFKLAPGEGTIKVEALTTGNMVLKVKIDNGMPITMELEGNKMISLSSPLRHSIYFRLANHTLRQRKRYI